MSKPSYCIPQPQRVRRIEPGRSFAWIDHRLLRDGFVPVMTHQDQSLYLFLSLVADRNGVSFYRKEKICDLLGLDFTSFEVARDRLADMGLVAFKPYSALSVNGFHQVLAVDGRPPDLASMTPVAVRPGPVPAAMDPLKAAPTTVDAADLASQLAAAFKTV